jgi:hypothetical protein
MPKTRQDRLGFHKKQERLQVGIGVPTASQLVPGVPVIRSVNGEVIEYIVYNGVLYKTVKTKA